MKILPTYTKKEITPEELEQTSERFLQEMFEGKLRAEWQDKLMKEHQLPRHMSTGRRVYLRWVIGIAASLLIGFGAWYTLSPTPSTDELLAIYLEDHVRNSETRKDLSPDNQTRIDAIAAYEERDYEEAARLRQLVVDESKEVSKEDYFYLGLSYLYQQPPQANSAIQMLSRVLEMPGRKFERESQWNLALAYLVSGNEAEAIPLLQSVKNANTNDRWNVDEATLILRSLENE